VLEEWARKHGGRLHWTRPRAGAICFFGYSYDTDSVPFVERLIRERSTMIVPGAHFLAERHLRIGFGTTEAILRAGLAEIDAALAALGEPATPASG
jgi:aspartate/methionine/tyrosine aminotransferase